MRALWLSLLLSAACAQATTSDEPRDAGARDSGAPRTDPRIIAPVSPPAPPTAVITRPQSSVCPAIHVRGCVLTDLSQCPPGATCRPNYACGNPGGPSAGYCCDLPPRCDPQDVQLAQRCPPGRPCYERTQCEITISCLRLPADVDAGDADAGP